MACRNGFVALQLVIPEELLWLIEQYQKDMKIISRNHTIRSLIEGSPGLAFTLARVYDNSSITKGDANGERVAS
jgi:hypothetical protein